MEKSKDLERGGEVFDEILRVFGVPPPPRSDFRRRRTTDGGEIGRAHV